MVTDYEIGYIDTDPTMGSGNDHWVPSQGAIKTALAGLPSIVRSATFLGKTGTTTGIINATSTGTVNHQLGVWITINSNTNTTVTISVSYTDQNSNAITQNLTQAFGAVGAYVLPNVSFVPKSGTSVTVDATVAGATINFDVGAYLLKINNL